MNFFINDVWAADPVSAAAPGGSFMSLLPFIAVFVIFYFLLIRPQTKRAKEHKAMVEALGKGDEVITNGGVLGRIVQVSDTFITLEIADGVQVKLQRQAVATLMPKGTFKSA